MACSDCMHLRGIFTTVLLLDSRSQACHVCPAEWRGSYQFLGPRRLQCAREYPFLAHTCMAAPGLTDPKPLLQFAEATSLKKYRFILEDRTGHRYTHTLYVPRQCANLALPTAVSQLKSVALRFGETHDVTNTPTAAARPVNLPVKHIAQTTTAPQNRSTNPACLQDTSCCTDSTRKKAMDVHPCSSCW